MIAEIRKFDGGICPNKSSIENKMIMSGIGIIYFVRIQMTINY